MKKLTLPLLILLVSLARLEADEVLENGDFLDGTAHWDGNGRPPSDFAPPTPLDPPSPYGTEGLIVPLKDHDWTKVLQEYHTKTASLLLKITYKLSPDAAFSSDDKDYQNVTHQIDWDAWPPISGIRGAWTIFSTDINSFRFMTYMVTPKHSDQVQTYGTTLQDLTIDNEQTLCFAFPPGKGAVILLRVSLKEKLNPGL